MVAQSKVSKSAAGLSEGTIPKAPKTPMAPKPPKKFVPNYKQLLLLHTCLESVLARPDISPVGALRIGQIHHEEILTIFMRRMNGT
jgi:hypothetical protein